MSLSFIKVFINPKNLKVEKIDTMKNIKKKKSR